MVAFSGAADLPCLRLLRPGFRHCFAVVRGGSHDEAGGMVWVVLDPLAHHLRIEAAPVALVGDAAAVAAHYRAGGLTALLVRRRVPSPPRHLPLRPLTCVEVVKRAIGCTAAPALTPWQLYRHLLATGAAQSS